MPYLFHLKYDDVDQPVRSGYYQGNFNNIKNIIMNEFPDIAPFEIEIVDCNKLESIKWINDVYITSKFDVLVNQEFLVRKENGIEEDEDLPPANLCNIM